MIHNRKRNRLQNYNYTTPGFYFVTICTQGMLEYFGHVRNGEMKLNDAGRIVQDRIKWLENHFEYIEIIKFVVMPNHVHIIIQIINVGTGRDLSDIKIGTNTKTETNTKTGIDIKIRTTRELSLRKFLRRIKSLSEIVGAFKTTSSKLIHQSGLNEFQWQRSFYDHIIRNDEELIRISDYIEKNPLLWNQDEYFIEL
jgi:REP element-mobilizing transposase RayT